MGGKHSGREKFRIPVLTAPASGAYVFSLTVTLYGTSTRETRGAFFITKNGITKVKVFRDTYDTSGSRGGAPGARPPLTAADL